MSSGSKDVRDLIKYAIKHGFRAERDASRHYVLRARNGKVVARLASTPSDVRGLRNARAALRRAGLPREDKS